MSETLTSIHQFIMKNTYGGDIPLSKYAHKVVLIVNTASECGFTPQFNDLQTLYESYSPDKFAILAFPSNDFGKQEPLMNEDIVKFCTRKFNVSFEIFAKINVRGQLADPLYKFLGDKKLNGNVKSTPKWNFHKYLINKKGEVVDYFLPFTKPNSAKVIRAINKLLAE